MNSQLSEAETEKCSWGASTSAVLTYYAGVVYDPCMRSVLLGDTEAWMEERKADVRAKKDKPPQKWENISPTAENTGCTERNMIGAADKLCCLQLLLR